MDYKTARSIKAFGQQFVAGQDPLQAQAQQLATQGIGAYQPFLTTLERSNQAGLSWQAGSFWSGLINNLCLLINKMLLTNTNRI